MGCAASRPVDDDSSDLCETIEEARIRIKQLAELLDLSEVLDHREYQGKGVTICASGLYERELRDQIMGEIKARVPFGHLGKDAAFLENAISKWLENRFVFCILERYGAEFDAKYPA